MKFVDWKQLADAAASSLHAFPDSVTVYLLHRSGAPVALLICEIRFSFRSLRQSIGSTRARVLF